MVKKINWYGFFFDLSDTEQLKICPIEYMGIVSGYCVCVCVCVLQRSWCLAMCI